MLMVYLMMMLVDMWDVICEDGVVGILYVSGLDFWVIDFGLFDEVEGGMCCNLVDYIVVFSEVVDIVKDVIGYDVYFVGYL